MQPITYFAIYFIVWWLCLFVVLPFRVRNQIDDGHYVQGTDPGAPPILRLWPKLLATTILAAVVTVLLLWGLGADWLRAYWS